MQIEKTINRWAGSRDARIQVARQNTSHTMDFRYPDAVTEICAELILNEDPARRPYMLIQIPVSRRTPMFCFGPHVTVKPDGEMDYAAEEVDATFPSFETESELTAALESVLADFLRMYRGPLGASKAIKPKKASKSKKPKKTSKAKKAVGRKVRASS